MRWDAVVKSGAFDARRALPRLRNWVQREGRGWLVLNVTMTCLSKELDGCQLTRRKPSASFTTFFGCRVLKSDRWYGRVFAWISKFIKGWINANS